MSAPDYNAMADSLDSWRLAITIQRRAYLLRQAQPHLSQRDAERVVVSALKPGNAP